MVDEVKDVIATLGSRELAFREQVERMRAFRDRMKEAGVDIKPNKFGISLTGGTAVVPRRVLVPLSNILRN